MATENPEGEGERRRLERFSENHNLYTLVARDSNFLQSGWLVLKGRQDDNTYSRNFASIRIGQSAFENTEAWIPLTKQDCLDSAVALNYVAMTWEEHDDD